MTGPLLVFGREGQLARELMREACASGLQAEAIGRAQLDLADPGADVAGVLRKQRPRAVINAAAWTAVDRAEAEPAAAFALNRDAPARLAAACAETGTPFVHVSTDYVFGAAEGAPFREADPISPACVYALSKAEGEAAVREAGGQAVTLRTSWVYASHGTNFVRTMLRLAESREEVGVVADQWGRPTWARELAQACLRAAEELAAGTLEDAPLLHVAGGGEATWADLAEAVFTGSAARGGPSARVRRIATADYPTPAPRPTDSRLDCSLAAARLGWRGRPWRDSLSACLEEMEFAA